MSQIEDTPSDEITTKMSLLPKTQFGEWATDDGKKFDPYAHFFIHLLYQGGYIPATDEIGIKLTRYSTFEDFIDTVEHEVVHAVLHKLIGEDSCRKYDNISNTKVIIDQHIAKDDSFSNW